jgi:hypothetical protein
MIGFCNILFLQHIVSAIYVQVVSHPYIKLMTTQLVAMVQNQLRCVEVVAFFLSRELCNWKKLGDFIHIL